MHIYEITLHSLIHSSYCTLIPYKHSQLFVQHIYVINNYTGRFINKSPRILLNDETRFCARHISVTTNVGICKHNWADACLTLTDVFVQPGNAETESKTKLSEMDQVNHDSFRVFFSLSFSFLLVYFFHGFRVFIFGE